MEMRKIYYNRKSIRLKNYDYSQNGMYFITICTHHRQNILSQIQKINCRGRFPPLPSNIQHPPMPDNKNQPQFNNNFQYTSNNKNQISLNNNLQPIINNQCSKNPCNKCIFQKNHQHLSQQCKNKFGIIHIYSEIGTIIENTITNINQINYVNIEPYVIMPNHVHFIVEINDKSIPQDTGRDGTLPLHAIIGKFKSYTTYQFNLMNKTVGTKLWQRGFYEHIIRNENAYNQICKYIKNNPIKYIL